mgnify:CR=1 FL=1
MNEAAHIEEEPGVITIYTTPGCMGCEMTIKQLTKAGLPFVVDLSTRPDLVEEFRSEGLMNAPIVEDQNSQRTAGFRPDRIRSLIAASSPTLSSGTHPTNASMRNTSLTRGGESKTL